MMLDDNPFAGFGVGSGEPFEIIAVRHGRLETTRARFYLNYDEYHEADAPITLAYYFWVIRNSTRTIVLDTGYSARGAAKRAREVLIPVPHALRLLGITAESEVDVVISHLHYDHAGNLDFFPRQRILVARAEYDFWTADESRRVQFRSVVDDEDVGVLERAAAEGRVTLVSGVTDVVPGVRIIELPGHTPGQLTVLVDTAGGPVLLASDATHFAEELDRDMPFKHNTAVIDLYRGLDRMRGWLRVGAVAHVIPGHEPATFVQYPRVSGALAEHAVLIGTGMPADAPRT